MSKIWPCVRYTPFSIAPMWQEFMFVVATHLMHDMKTACPAAATALVAFESSPWCVRHRCWWMISWGVALPFKNIGEYRNPQTGNPYSPKFQTKTYWSRLGCFCNYPMGKLKGNYEYQQNTTSPAHQEITTTTMDNHDIMTGWGVAFKSGPSTKHIQKPYQISADHKQILTHHRRMQIGAHRISTSSSSKRNKTRINHRLP